jgi:ribosomal-protein-alanine N-acetyltransferase
MTERARERTGEPEAWEERPDHGPDFRYPRFYTPRLMLKEPRSEDQEFLANMFSDPKVRHYIHDGALSKDNAIRYADAIIKLTRFSVSHGWWVVSRREDAQPLGLVRLGKYENVPLEHPWGDDLQIDYEFAVSSWGHGYAIEALSRVLAYAFGWLYGQELPVVLAWTRVDNLRSQKLLVRLGFEQMGNCRDEATVPQPCFLYKLTREKWMELRRV